MGRESVELKARVDGGVNGMGQWDRIRSVAKCSIDVTVGLYR